MFRWILLFLFTLNLCGAIQAHDVSVSEIFLKRHSGKSFDPSRNVPMEHVMALVEAARWTPSSHNDQPWNFIICERSLTPEAYQKVFCSLKAETQQKWAVNAPLLIVVVSRSKDLYKGNFNPWHAYDTGAAAMSLSLQAADLNLMTHQIGGFNKQMIIEEFHLPEDCQPQTIIVVGYESLDADVYPRERRPTEANFFLGQWGVGLNDTPGSD